MSDIRLKLSNVQQALKAPKSQWNDFSKYHYRNQEDILEGLKPLLKKEGLLLTLSDEVVNIGEANYVKAEAKLRTIDEEDREVIVTAYAREEVSLKGQIAAQITGGASSYARKYALNGLFNIDDSQDPDSQNNEKVGRSMPPMKTVVTDTPKTTKQVKERLATEKQIKLILDKAKERGSATKEEALAYVASEYGINDITKLTLEDASILIEELISTEQDLSQEVYGDGKHND